MLTPTQVIHECAKVSSTTAKQTILLSNRSDILLKCLDYALNPYKVYGIKKFEVSLADSPARHSNIQIIFDLCDKLISRDYTGDRARSTIEIVSSHLAREDKMMLVWILEKDFKAGIGIGTVNKCFPKLIPEFEVQLAQPSKFLGRVIYPCMIQPKMDGVRTLAIVDPHESNITYYSRNGKEFLNFTCFNAELLKMARNKSMVFDGEVIGSTKGKEFDGIMNQCRRKFDVDPTGLNFHVFDVIPSEQFSKQKANLKQIDRTGYLEDLEGLLIETPLDKRRVTFVDYRIVKSEEELMQFYDVCVKDGYEGIIIKQLDGEYEFKRSCSWIKMKPENDIDLKVVEIQEGNGKYAGLLGAIIVDHNGTRVNVGSGFKDDERVTLEKAQSLIGKTVEVTYDSVTKDNSLRFPRFKRIREDK